MISLHEQLRPQRFADVIGQEKAVRLCEGLLARGLGGRAVWVTGQSGTGKTTLAKLLAESVADPFCIEETTGRSLTVNQVKEFVRVSRLYGIGRLNGRAFIVNEAHGLARPAIEELLDVLESIPGHAVWIFTTTNDGQERLFEDATDAHPLLSRCTRVALARQGIAKPFAEHLERIDPGPKRPTAYYLKLIQECKNNLRDAIQRLEAESLTELADVA